MPETVYPKDPVIGSEIEGALVPGDPGATKCPEPHLSVRPSITIGIPQSQNPAVVRAVWRLPERDVDIPVRTHRHVSRQPHLVCDDDGTEGRWKDDSSVRGIAHETRGRHPRSIHGRRGDIRRPGGTLGAMDDERESCQTGQSAVLPQRWSGHANSSPV